MLTQPPPLIRAYLDAYNALDAPGMLALLAEDVRFENYANGVLSAEATGVSAFKDLAELGVDLFASRRQDVLYALTVRNRTIIDVDFKAVVAANPPPGWTAGQELKLRGRSYFETRDGRIALIIDEI